jgi:predicted transcriptional regulator
MSKREVLSRREREIMDIIYGLGQAAASEVRRHMHDPPSDSAVRTTLGILEAKGLLKHEADGKRYVYRPTVPPGKARQRALEHVVSTFFDGSAAGAVLALLERPGEVSDDDLNRMAELIARARGEGR